MKAARLRRRADRRRRDGTRSVFARLALSMLVQAGDRGDQTAVDAVWDMWLDDPDEVLWERLARWHRPARDIGLRGSSLVALDEGSVDDAAFRTALAEAAVRTDHPIGEIARRRILSGDQDVVDAACAMATTRPALVPLCAEHGLAPADPVERSEFFLLTGQTEQYRAADPDGSLLALAYETAGADVRARLRTAMVEAGDLDVARVLVGAGRPIAEEARYLTTRLADRRAWDQLWRLVQHLPLVEAVTAAGLFDDWRPAGARDRTLFDRLAVITTPGLRPGQGAISVFDLAGGGRLVERYELTTALEHVLTTTAVRLAVRFVPLGAGLIAANPQLLPGTHDVHSGMLWSSDGDTDAAVRALLPLPAGGFVAYTMDEELEFRRGNGDLVSTLGLHAELGPRRHSPAVRALAIEPDSGRLAVAGDGLAIFDTRDAEHVRLLAHERLPGSPTIYGAAFLDENHLVTTDMDLERGVRGWRLTGNRLEWRTAPAGVIERVRSPIVIPQRREIAVIDWRGDVWYFDAGSLTVSDVPRELTGTRGHALWASPRSGHHALGGDGFVEVISPAYAPAVAALAERPLAEMTPAELGTVSAALRDLPPGSPARPLLELLRGCLDHRFASDVQLGTAAATGGLHDIALTDAQGDEPPC